MKQIRGLLLHTGLIFPHYIPILFNHWMLLSKEILVIPKITSQNAKNPSQLLKNIFACGGVKALLCLAFLLLSQTHHLDTSFFLKNRPIHFHINSTSVRPVKQNQFVLTALKSTSHFLPLSRSLQIYQFPVKKNSQISAEW